MLSLLAALALCAALAAAWASARRALSVGRALDVDVDELVAWAKRPGGSAGALAAALDRTTVAELSRALAESRGDERRCNEALVELGDELAHDDELHLGMLRLVGYATGLAAVLVVFEPLTAAVAGREPAEQPLGLLDTLALGGGAFVSALATRRISARVSRRRRTAIDRWVAAALGHAGEELKGSKRPSR